MRNHSNENEFDLHENELVGGTHFHMNGFALRLVLTRRQKGNAEMAFCHVIFDVYLFVLCTFFPFHGSTEKQTRGGNAGEFTANAPVYPWWNTYRKHGVPC